MNIITIAPVIGGFIIEYPQWDVNGEVKVVIEVVTTIGKAMRVTKKAVEAFSLVAKSKDDAEA